jgi:LmbE family N-acetylglucosaminyl deacetylase
LKSTDRAVTTWRFDGDADHQATARATAVACVASGCRLLEAPVWMWHWARPADRRVPWQRLRGLAQAKAPLDLKRLALAAHVSQLVPHVRHAAPVLDDLIVERLDRTVEYYFV